MRPKMRRCALAVVLVFIAVGVPTTAVAQADGVPSPAFATPEDAFRHFFGALGRGDLDGALEAVAIDEHVRDFDFEGLASRIQALVPGSMLPGDYELYRRLNLFRRLDEIGTDLQFFVYSLLRPDLDHRRPTILQDPDFFSSFVRSVDPGRLAALSLVDLMIPSPELFFSERNQENMQRTAGIYGADDMEEYVLLFEFEGRLVAGAATVFRYGEGWKIGGLQGLISGLWPGELVPMESRAGFRREFD